MFNAVFFFFKQKTAYEMRISDWSSDVCSSDLTGKMRVVAIGARERARHRQFGQRPQQRVVAQVGGDVALHVVAERTLEIPALRPLVIDQIGRASCRERVCQYV